MQTVRVLLKIAWLMTEIFDILEGNDVEGISAPPIDAYIFCNAKCLCVQYVPGEQGDVSCAGVSNMYMTTLVCDLLHKII